MILPLYYHGRINGNTDRHEIEKRLAVFSDEQQQRVANKYSSKYRAKGRISANLWLHKLAVRHRKMNKEK